MSWSGKRIVPTDWGTRKRRVLKESGGICYLCGLPGADEVDHIVPVAEAGSYDYSNLAAVHRQPCHRDKTKAEIARGHARRPRARREPERHPGLRA